MKYLYKETPSICCYVFLVQSIIILWGSTTDAFVVGNGIVRRTWHTRHPKPCDGLYDATVPSLSMQRRKNKNSLLPRYALVGSGSGGDRPINPDGYKGEMRRPNEYGGGGGGMPAGAYTPTSGAMYASSPPQNSPTKSQQDKREERNNIWEALTPIKVQGGSLRTWSFSNPNVNRIQVLMRTDGRPLISNIELWQGPDNTPQKMGVYIEDGNVRTFNVIIETPRSGGNAVAIRNTGHLEYPLEALVDAEVRDPSKQNDDEYPLLSTINDLRALKTAKILQGGAIRTYPFDPSVASIQCLLTTDGRPLNARIELIQGPNNNKQIIELYTEDGNERPFFAIIETPGSGNVVRIVNTAPMEYPMMATVEPYMVDDGSGGGYDYGQYDSGGGPMFVGGIGSTRVPSPDSIY